MKCWGMEVSMQNLAPSQMPCEEERGFPGTPNETNKKLLLLPAFVLHSHLGTPVMFSPASPHPLKLREIPVYSRTEVELPKLKECTLSSLDYRLQLSL